MKKGYKLHNDLNITYYKSAIIIDNFSHKFLEPIFGSLTGCNPPILQPLQK
jgi:hypothetical protein